MDIKGKIEQIVQKLMADKNLKQKFSTNPVAVIEDLIGIDLPDDVVNQVIEGVKAKINLEKVGDALGALFKK